MTNKKIGRFLIALFFIMTAIKSILNFKEYKKFIGTKLSYPVIIASIAIIVKLVGGILVATDKYMKYGVISLIAITIVGSLIYSNDFKAIAIIGGLLLLL